MVGWVVIAIAPESKSSIEASTRFVGERFTQTFCQVKDRGEEEEGVTPDPMVECPKCHQRFRVGRKQ